MRLQFWRRARRPGAEISPAVEPGRHADNPQVFYPAPLVDHSQPTEPAVSIGFRDGTTVDVAPDSPQGRALRAAAEVLVNGEER